MKKYLLAAGVLALASISLFTSCKDDDEKETEVVAKASLTDAQLAQQTKNALAAEDAKNDGTDVKTEGNVVTTTVTKTTSAINKDGNVTTTTTSTSTSTNATTGESSTTEVVSENEYSYIYEIEGVTYTSLEDVQAAINQMEPGKQVTISVQQIKNTTTTTKVDDKITDVKVDQTKSDPVISNIVIPGEGSATSAIAIPTSQADPTKTANVNITVTVGEKQVHNSTNATTR